MTRPASQGDCFHYKGQLPRSAKLGSAHEPQDAANGVRIRLLLALRAPDTTLYLTVATGLRKQQIST